MKSLARALGVLAFPLFASMVPAKVLQIIQGYDVTYPKGKIGGGSETGLPAQYVPIKPASEYYLDYQVMFLDGWEWVKGGKLPGLVGGSHTSGCASITPGGWSARFMWRGSSGHGEVYLYHQHRKNGCGDDYGFPSPGDFFKGEWNRITERVVINTPGKDDGMIEAWYNGKKQLTMNNLQLRGKVADDVALVDAVSLQTFYGGSTSGWAPPHDTHARFSNLYVRDDIPDMTQSFEGANEVATLPASARAPAGNPRYALSWLGNGSVTVGRAGEAGRVDILDAAGRVIRSLAASGRTSWDGLDAAGGRVTPGILFVRFSADLPH
jgi:hypothetical protein